MPLSAGVEVLVEMHSGQWKVLVLICQPGPDGSWLPDSEYELLAVVWLLHTTEERPGCIHQHFRFDVEGVLGEDQEASLSVLQEAWRHLV